MNSSSLCLPVGRGALWLFMSYKRPRGQPVISRGTQKGWEEIWAFPPGLGSSSAPNGKGKNGCGGLGIFLVLEGTRGGFLVYLGVQQCAPAPEQGFSFPAGQQGKSRCLLLGQPFLQRVSLPLPFPACQQLCRAHSWGLFAGSLMTPWTFGHQQGFFFFLLCVWTSRFASPITCRAGCPGAGGSLWIPASVSVPMR